MDTWVDTWRRSVLSLLKVAAKTALLKMERNVDRPSLIGRGTIQDLYYWVCDDRIDTNILLNNFYSVFFPRLETATVGTVTIHDPQGRRLGMTEVSVGHLQCVKLTLSHLLRQWRPTGKPAQFGSLLFALAIPPAVLEALSTAQGSFYFWHRFYIEYITRAGQPAFVHCVDKTAILRHGRSRAVPWYPRPMARDWALEMPLNIDEYRRLFVILMNRSSRPVPLALTVTDDQDRAKRFPATLPPRAVHRFELSRQILYGLAPSALRMRVVGMPTTWARPVLFKEFDNGTISAMHC